MSIDFDALRSGILPADFEDEEIDEDVFTAEDYKKYGNVGGGPEPESDGDDLDDEEDGDAAGKYMSLSDMIDASADVVKPTSSSSSTSNGALEEDDEEEEEFEYSDDEDVEEGDSDASDDAEGKKHGELVRLVNDLSGSRKRRKLRVRTEQVAESLTALPSVSRGDDAAPSTAASKLAVLKQALSRPKSIQRLNDLSKDPVSRRLAKPLPDIRKEEIERKVAYKTTKEDVSKWQGLVKQNRQVAQLRFARPPKAGSSLAALHAKFTASNDFEKDFSNLLEGVGMGAGSEAEIRKGEELALNELSPKEAAERRAQLKKLGALMFYQEKKFKRIKKIKSKEYHRQMRKLRKKHQLSFEELKDIDPELAAEEQYRRQYRRAEERMTMRHKNTGKWARRMALRREKLDEGTKTSMKEQTEINRDLRKKMDVIENSDQEDGDDDSDDDDDFDFEDGDDDDDDEDNSDGENRRKHILERLQSTNPEPATKGLFSMKFMQRAEEKRRQEEEKALKEFEEERELELMRFKTKHEKAAMEDDDDDSSRPSRPSTNSEEIQQTVEETVDSQSSGGDKKDAPSIAALLSGSLQTVQAAMASGHKTRVSGFISTSDAPKSNGVSSHVDDTESKENAMESLFDTVEFEETNGESSSVAFGLLNSTPATSRSADSDQSSAKPSTRKNQRASGAKRKLEASNGVASGEATQQISHDSPTVADDVITVDVGKSNSLFASSGVAALVDDEEDDVDEVPRMNGDLAQQAEIVALEESTSSSKQSKKRKLSAGAGETNDVESPSTSSSSKVDAAVEDNPWLQPEVDDDKPSDDSKTSTSSNNTATDSKAKKKRRKRNKKKKDAALPDNIDPKNQMLLGDSSANGDGEENFRLLGSASEEQKKLIQRAFANAGVEEEEFEQQKDKLHTRKKKKKSAMDGWGSWTGFGVRKRNPQPAAKKSGKSAKVRKDPNRKDARLKNVIISEKKDKKSSKYRLQQLPHPYTSHKQYERSLAQPIGRDWNTSSAHGKLTRPEVLTRPGIAIEPLKFTETIKEAKQRSRAANELQLRGSKSKGKSKSRKANKRKGL